jgi:hypothetical protein
LARQGIPYVNLFEEVNILADIIKQNSLGLEINEKLQSNIKNNNLIPGINELSPYLFSQTYRSAAIIYILDHIIRNVKPKSVVAAAASEMLENLAIEISKRYSIPSFSLLPGTVEFRSWFSDWFHSDKIFVSGTKGLEILKKLGYDETRIVVTGNPKYDYINDLEPNHSRKLLAKNLPLNIEKKIIAVVMSRWHTNDEIWMSKLIKFCNVNDFELLIKIHPLYKREANYISEEKISKIKEECQNLRYYISYDVDLPTLLSSADLVITEYSDAGLEAIILDKPLLTVNFENENFDRYIKYYEYGASLYIDRYEELESVIKEILVQKKYIEKLKEGRKKVVEIYNHAGDGKAAERIFNILIKQSKS